MQSFISFNSSIISSTDCTWRDTNPFFQGNIFCYTLQNGPPDQILTPKQTVLIHCYIMYTKRGTCAIYVMGHSV